MARLLGVSTAASTGIVDRLVDRGHAERGRTPRTGAGSRCGSPRPGATRSWSHLGPMFAGLAALDASFDEAELAVVERYLRGAIDALEAVIHPPSAE